MKSFKTYLSEGISPAGLHKAAPIIASYLKGKIGADMFHFPEAEEYHNSHGQGYGIRFFIPKGNRSFRINWSSPSSIGLVGIKSVDVWLDSPESIHAEFDVEASMVKTLPLIADMLNGDVKSGTLRLTPNDVPLNESVETVIKYLMEAYDPDAAFDGMMKMAAAGELKKFGPGSVYDSYKGTGSKIYDELRTRFPKLLVKDGVAFAWKGTPADVKSIIAQKAHILDAIGATKASISKGSMETYKGDSKLVQFEKNIDRLSYVKQLEDLERLIGLTLAGSANALFIAGRGGIGKTHTVEKVLAKHGLQDNNGYFKNTGTASAAGIYSLLFRHRDGVVVFDDSDDALGDQEARNIFKAATDTKKVRKLVWNKMGKNVVDPDDISDEEIEDEGLIPRYFEFTGKIIFISNLPMQKLDPDGAIRTRAYLIDIDPTDEEVYDFMEKICDEIPLQEGLKLDHSGRMRVVKLLRNSKSKQSANLRKLSRGLNMSASGLNISDAELTRMISTYAAWTFFIGLAALQFLFC